MGISEVASRGKPQLYGVSINTSRAELSKAMSSVRPRAHKGAKGNGFGGNAGKDIKGVSRNNVGEVRDYSNAVLGIGSLVGRSVIRRRGMRKSRGRVRT
jgi:hypothetical protein